MPTIRIKDREGRVLITFDDRKWEFYTDYHSDTPVILNHEEVLNNPVYLFQQLEDMYDPEQILNQLSAMSPELKKMIEDFKQERFRLEKRIVLFQCAGHGMIDEFTDLLSLSICAKTGKFVVETSIIGDTGEEELNALGEIEVKKVNNVTDAAQLYDAILAVTSDDLDRWDNIDWSWEEVIRNIRRVYPKLASELKTKLSRDVGDK